MGVSTLTVSPCAPRVSSTWMFSAKYMPAMKTPTTASAARIRNATNTPASTPPVFEWFRFMRFPSLMLRNALLKSSQKSPADLPETHFHVRLVLQVYRVHKTHARRRERHDDGLRAGTVAKKAHALQQIAVGDAACGKDNLAARRELLCRVNLLGVLNPHGLHALALWLVFDDEPSEYFAIQAAQRRGRQDAFGSATGAHHRVHARTRHRRRDSGREV